MTKKVCSKCNLPKDLEDFPVNRTKKDGRGYHCRECHKVYTNRHYTENRDYYTEKARKSASKRVPLLRALVRAAKNRPCVDCGQTFPPFAMDLDHISGEKVICVSHMVKLGYGVPTLRREIAKCEVRCAVCHRIRSHGCNGKCGKSPPSETEITQVYET